MGCNPTTIKIDNVEYVRKDKHISAATLDGLEYVIIRTRSAGVFAAYLESRTGQEATLRQSRRLWYWDGAASLSELAMCGVSKPQKCKFPIPIDKQEVTEVSEVLFCTEKARISIAEVPIWTAQK